MHDRGPVAGGDGQEQNGRQPECGRETRGAKGEERRARGEGRGARGEGRGAMGEGRRAKGEGRRAQRFRFLAVSLLAPRPSPIDPQAFQRPESPGQHGGGLDQRQVDAMANHEAAEHRRDGAEDRRHPHQAQPAQVQVGAAAGKRKGHEERKRVRQPGRKDHEQPGRRVHNGGLRIGHEGHAGGLARIV